MKDERKTKKQLVEELEGERHQIAVVQGKERVLEAVTAMRSSDDLLKVVGVVYREIKEFSVDTLGCGITFIDDSTEDMIQYAAWDNPRLLGVSWDSDRLVELDEQVAVAVLDGSITDPATYVRLWRQGDAWQRQRTPEEVETGRRIQIEGMGLHRYIPEPGGAATVTGVPFTYGVVAAIGLGLGESQIAAVQELTSALELGYTRYLDFQRLEEQNRELEIEQILERVRGQALGMRRSEDLPGVASAVFRELGTLDLTVWRCGFGIFNDQCEPPELELWYTTAEGDARPAVGTYRLDENASSAIGGLYLVWKRGEEHYCTDRSGDELKAMIAHLTEDRDLSLPEWGERPPEGLPERLWFDYFFFPQGFLQTSVLEPVPGHILGVLKQLAAIFGVAYSRFLELKQAEENARQAERRAAVDRVRAEIATMRTSADLEQLTPLIWKELTDAAVPFFRCGVFIVNEEGKRVQSYLANPQGEFLGYLDLAADSHPALEHVLESWRAERVYFEQWDQTTFLEWMEFLQAQGQNVERERYQDAGQPPESLSLHFVPFAQGMLYVGSPARLPEEDLSLVQEIATAFSVAYARYLDFERLEERALELAREAAVERVRAVTLAMRTTDDLMDVVAAMHRELLSLDSRRGWCDIFFVDAAVDEVSQYKAYSTPDRLIIHQAHEREYGDGIMAELTRRFAAGERPWAERGIWEEQAPARSSFTLTREMLLDLLVFRKAWPTTPEVEEMLLGEHRTLTYPFAHGVIQLAQRHEFSDEDEVMVGRFTEALSLAFVRFLDFQNVERTRQRLIDSLEEELRTAHDMQMGLMPAASPDVRGVSIAGHCSTANRVGGDFYQYFEHVDGLAISLADVTGHSMVAAIPAVMFSGILDNQMESPKPLPELFQSLNRSLCRSLGEHTYVCLSMLDLDLTSRTMEVANCGCPYPLHYHPVTGQIDEIQVEAYPLGIRPDTDYAARDVALEPGDYVVLHSDGFSEATNADRQLFGFDRTMEMIRQGCSEGVSPEDLIERLIGEVKAFSGDEPQADDMTCVVVRVEG